jgi:hypothetical protein
VPESPSLTTLLSWVWITYTIEADNAVEAAATERVRRLFRISLPMWANGLRLIGDEGITVAELRGSARASCNIGGLERWGWISVGAKSGGHRDGFGSQRGVKADTMLYPTRAGVFARRIWPEVVDEVEARWRIRFGTDAIDGLHAALATHAFAMPWSPPDVHAADGFHTAVLDSEEPIGEPGPLVARVGQALTALTVEHERDAIVSLPLGANVLRVIDDGAVPIRALPARSGVSKEAIAMAVNFLKRTKKLEDAANRSVELTAAGQDALTDYRTRAARPQDRALRAALQRVVEQPDALAAGLVPPAGGWRGEKPYRAQTERVLAGPLAALPWHPMVLHRGGWPDGS